MPGDRRPRRSAPGRAGRGRAARSLVALLLACATLITLDYHGGTGSPMEPARRAMGEVFGPGRGGRRDAVRPVTAVPDWFRTRSSMRHEIATLPARTPTCASRSTPRTATATAWPSTTA